MLASLPVGVALLSGCSSGTSAPSRLRVAVSIFPLFDLARRVAGERLEVVCVLPPGRSEHGFDPSPREVAAVSGARAGIVVGLEMDEWAERIVTGAATGTTPEMLRLGPSVDPRRLTAHEVGLELEEHGDHHEGEAHEGEAHEEAEDHHEGEAHEGEAHEGEAHHEGGEAHEEHHHHGAFDPHFWLDPVRAQTAVDRMAELFSRLDPEGAAGYTERAERVRGELDALHREIEGRARSWTRRTIVTFHGSFGYYAERYGLTIAAVIEPFPGREPTPRYIQEVLGAVAAAHAAALFSEPQLDRHPAQVIADSAHVPLFELDPIGTGATESYEALLRANTDVLARALA
jgi:zinc transport system substrate-binding protein